MGKKFFDFLTRKEAPPTASVCLFSSEGKTVEDYNVKENRAEAVTYQGIGRIRYGTGIPPAVYDTVVASIKKYPIVFGCVTAISEALAGLSIKVYDVKGGLESEVPDHPFYGVYSQPNPYQGSFEFIEQVSQSLDVTGNAFIAIEKGTSGKLGTGSPIELYLLPSKYVAIIPDPKTKVKEYRYYINGQSVAYKPEEIIHIKYSDVDDSYYGAPPLASANDILTFENYRIQFSNQFFKNGAIPVGLLETEQVLGDTLLGKLRTEWTKIHGGISNAHKVAILQGGLSYKAITSPIKDLDLGNLKRLSKEDIQIIFKVPDSILGSQVGTGSKEGRDALTAFWRGSLIPRIRRIESAINRGLKQQLFSNGTQKFAFDLKKVEALSDDKESTAKYLSMLLSSSVMTPNEARAVIGLPKSTDKNADLLYISNAVYGNQLIPAEQAGNATANNDTKPTVKPGGGASQPAAAAKPKPTPSNPKQ